MSDFLTGLVQRHEAPASLVRPRLPSLFENAGHAVRPATVAPDDGASEPGIREEQVFSEVAQPMPHAAAPARPSTPDPQNAQAQPSPFIAPQRETILPAPRAAMRERDDDAEPGMAAPSPEFARAPAWQEPRPLHAIVPTEDRQPSGPQIVERLVEHTTRLSEQTFVTEAPRPVPAREPVAARDEQAQPIAPFAPQPAPESPRPAAPPFETAQAAARQPSRAEARREARQAQRAEAEPVIHVSIGRIEVRAVEERDTRARKSDAPSPVMPLDEYLRSRAKR